MLMLRDRKTKCRWAFLLLIIIGLETEVLPLLLDKKMNGQMDIYSPELHYPLIYPLGCMYTAVSTVAASRFLNKWR